MEGAVTYLKMRDRKLTEKFLSLAVKDDIQGHLLAQKHRPLAVAYGLDIWQPSPSQMQPTVAWHPLQKS